MYVNQANAILSTWADEHTWFVTKANLSTPRILTLPDSAWEGGYDANTERFFNYILPLVATRFFSGPVHHYDWLLKVDPDTYVHHKRLQQALGSMLTGFPAYMGLVFGSSLAEKGPGSSVEHNLSFFPVIEKNPEMRNIAFANQFYFKPDTGFAFAHGGAGKFGA